MNRFLIALFLACANALKEKGKRAVPGPEVPLEAEVLVTALQNLRDRMPLAGKTIWQPGVDAVIVELERLVKTLQAPIQPESVVAGPPREPPPEFRYQILEPTAVKDRVRSVFSGGSEIDQMVDALVAIGSLPEGLSAMQLALELLGLVPPTTDQPLPTGNLTGLAGLLGDRYPPDSQR